HREVESVRGTAPAGGPGAEPADKPRVLRDSLGAGGGGPLYVPVDISTEMLHETANTLAGEYPDLRVRPVVADITDLEPPLPGDPGTRLVLFLGGTIGNLTEDERDAFLRMLRRVAGPGDRIALGFDVRKSPERLVAAYDDA